MKPRKTRPSAQRPPKPAFLSDRGPARMRQPSASDLSRAGGHVASTLAREYWEALENPKGKTLSAILREHPEAMGLLNDFQKFKTRQYLAAMARWYGWLRGHSQRLTEWPMLLASLLESDRVDDTHRAWARRCNIAPERLMALGDAPNWVVRGEGYRRLVGSNRANVDPWSLLPGWLRGHLPDPPPDESPKVWHAAILEGFQYRPYRWVRLRDIQKNRTIEDTLEKLEEQTGQSAWRARKMPAAVRWPTHVKLPEVREPWAWIAQDFSDQITAQVCDPDPGERWCLIEPRDLSIAIDLADRMKGKGVVVVVSANERLLRAASQLAKRCGCHNVTTRGMAGDNLPGKPGIYDGVLVDMHGMGMDRWRSQPETRHRCDERQLKTVVAAIDARLRSAAKALKSGGRLVYAVGSLTSDETDSVADRFVADNPGMIPLEFEDPRTGKLGPPRMHFWPERDWGEAVFVARWTKSTPLSAGERKDNVSSEPAAKPKARRPKPQELEVPQESPETVPTPTTDAEA